MVNTFGKKNPWSGCLKSIQPNFYPTKRYLIAASGAEQDVISVAPIAVITAVKLFHFWVRGSVMVG